MNQTRSARPSGAPTIYDVANLAGVSTTTVSHALNRPERVGEATLARVLEAIDELDFVPKEVAATRARNAVGRIGVLAPFSSYPSYAQRLSGVFSSCGPHALEVVVFDHGSVADQVSPLLSTLPIRGRLDGLIVMGIPLDDSAAERLTRRSLPTVLVDSEHSAFSSVTADDHAGGYLIGQHLVERGRTAVAFVGEGQRSSDYVSAGQRRIAGVNQALSEAGLESMRIERTTNNVAGGVDAAHELTAHTLQVDAVVANHDTLAAGLVRGLRDRGVVVPDDVAIAGYDGGVVADAVGLTTIVQPFEESGALASDLLIEAIDGQRNRRTVVLGVELRTGTTT